MVKEVISYIKALFPWKYLLIARFRLKKSQEGLDSLEILANIYFSLPKLRSITFGIRLIWWVISLTPALFSLAQSDLSFSQNEACKKAGFHHPGWFSVAQRWQTLLLCKQVEVISSVLNTGVARNLKDAVIGLSRRHWTMNVCLLSVCKSRWIWIKPRHALLQTKKDCVFLTILEGTTPTNLPISILLGTLIERESGSNRRSSKSVSQVKTESCKRSFLECLEKLSHLENHSKISKEGSLHTKSFWRIHLSVFGHSWTGARKAIAKSRTLRLQRCFIHKLLIWTEVLFLQRVSGACTSPFLDADKLKMALPARKVSDNAAPILSTRFEHKRSRDGDERQINKLPRAR